MRSPYETILLQFYHLASKRRSVHFDKSLVEKIASIIKHFSSSCPLLCLQRQVVKVANGLFYCCKVNMTNNSQLITFYWSEDLSNSIASTVTGDESVRRCDNVNPHEEKSRSDCALAHCAANKFRVTLEKVGNCLWCNHQKVNGLQSVDLTSKFCRLGVPTENQKLYKKADESAVLLFILLWIVLENFWQLLSSLLQSPQLQ